MGWLLFFIAVSLIWTSQTNFTWDDDAITRYWNTEQAARQYGNFFDSWDRPLFVWFFYIPVHVFGKWGMAVTMTLLTAASGLLLYQSVKTRGIENAWVVVVFLVFQTFLFGITRDAMTEPLASFLISLGIFFFYKKQYGWMLLVGGFLPLARLETVVLLPVWLIPVIKEKKYRLIPLLGLGMIVWAGLWLIIMGNVQSFYHNIFMTGASENRYGRTELDHHISMYIYVVGPVLFYFLLLGLLWNTRKVFSDYFILFQFLLGFSTYVVFAAYFDLGQSGGALRNLVTLAPFAAIIALYGFNKWAQVCRPLFEKGMRKSDRKNGGKRRPKKSTAAAAETGDTGFFSDKGIVSVYSMFVLVITVKAFSGKLVLRSYYDPVEKDFQVLFFISAVLFFIFIPMLAYKAFKPAVYGLAALQVIFTLNFESPQSHGNAERVAMNELTGLVRTSALSNARIYCNHPWFYWAMGKSFYEPGTYRRIDSASIKKATAGDVFVWEAHYNNKNYSNVPVTAFINDTSFSPLFYQVTEDNKLAYIVFVKSQQQLTMELFNKLEKEWPSNCFLYYCKGLYERSWQKNLPAAIGSFSAAIQVRPFFPEALYDRAVCHLLLNQRSDACADLQRAASLGFQQAVQLLPRTCR